MTELVKNEGNSFNKSLQKSPETEADEEVEEADENFSTERETDHLPHTLMRLLTCTNLSSAHSLHTKHSTNQALIPRIHRDIRELFLYTFPPTSCRKISKNGNIK